MQIEGKLSKSNTNNVCFLTATEAYTLGTQSERKMCMHVHVQKYICNFLVKVVSHSIDIHCTCTHTIKFPGKLISYIILNHALYVIE